MRAYLWNLSYKNIRPRVAADQQLLPTFQLYQTPKKKREGVVDKKVEVHAPVIPLNAHLIPFLKIN